MRPLMYSSIANKGYVGFAKEGWVRCGENVLYFQNSKITGSSEEGSKVKHLNTLSFEVSFEYHNDEVYFANTYPYSYSDLNVYLDYVNHLPKINDIMRMYEFDTKSLAGNNLQCLVITDFTNEPEEIS